MLSQTKIFCQKIFLFIFLLTLNYLPLFFSFGAHKRKEKQAGKEKKSGFLCVAEQSELPHVSKTNEVKELQKYLQFWNVMDVL